MGKHILNNIFNNEFLNFCNENNINLLIKLYDNNDQNEYTLFKSRNISRGFVSTVSYNNYKFTIKTSRKRDLPLLTCIIKEKVKSYHMQLEKEQKDTILYAIKKVSDGLNRLYDKESILQLILDTATEITRADLGAILLIADENVLKLIVASGPYQHMIKQIKINVGEGITGWVAKNATIANVRDVKNDPRYFEAISDIQSELAVPLILNDDVIGVLNVDSFNLNAFNETHEILLENLASQAAKIIENAHLYNKASQKIAELSILFQINKAINTILNLDELLEKIVQIIGRIMAVERISLLLKEGGMLRVKAGIGLNPEIINKSVVKIGEGISGIVAKQGQALLIHDLKNDPEYSRFYRHDLKNNSVLSVPIKHHTELVGVINVNNKKNGEPFNEDDLKLLETISIQIASAISNARLYKKSIEKLNELSLINSLGKKLNSTLELSEIVGTLKYEIMETFNTRNVDLYLFKEVMPKSEDNNHFRIPKHLKIIDMDFLKRKGLFKYISNEKRAIVLPDELKEKIGTFFNIESNYHDILLSLLIFKNKYLGIIVLEKNNTSHTPLNEVLELLSTIASQGASALQNALLYSELISLYLMTVQSLAAAIDAKDPYTHGHSQRVAEYAALLAEEISCDLEEIEIIRHTALLHDIGKIGIPENILLKPGKLTDEEYKEIKKHPILGTDILKKIKYLDRVNLFLKYHHERYDGLGYPDGLTGEKIPLGARIIAIADTFDAMTSDRPYRKGCSIEEALMELKRCANTQFDPELVKAFERIVLFKHKKLKEIINSFQLSKAI